MDIRKKKRWFLLIAVVIWLIWFYSRPQISLNEAVPELDIASIHYVYITNGRIVELDDMRVEETERLISILDSLAMKKKIIPNIPAFNDDARIWFNAANTEGNYEIRIDYKRNIIGITEYPKMMKQYILEDSSDLFSFVQNHIKNAKVVD
ncbi:hypothetical protein ACIQ2D_09190 [Lysinibacillus sp. NPDC097287]|uniref:hypothetical protein n=1 Tax=Lysinibacillus sp. NPDC097287 TaxID=3364144 RepID=UPI00381F888B